MSTSTDPSSALALFEAETDAPAFRALLLRFGLPAAGSKVFVRCNQFVDGYEDLPHEFYAIVPASA